MAGNKFSVRMSRRTALVLSAVSSCMMLSGCLNLAPGYERPEAPAETSGKWVSPVAEAGLTEGELEAWEVFFRDERLKKVIGMALENNRDLRAAALEVERLRAQYRVSRSQLMPTVAAAADASHSKSSMDTTMPGAHRISHAYAANLAMTSYELDFFGRVRNMNEMALEAYLQSDDARRSARNTIIAEVAAVWLSVGADRAMLDLANETLRSQSASYGLVEKSFRAGAANQLELSQASTTVASARVAVQNAEQSLAQDLNALRFLAGAEVPAELLPSKIDEGVTKNMVMPAGLPSEVLLRRPDIMSAERGLLAANANIGAARAAFFPRVTLTSSIGTLSTDMSNLFDGGRGTWGFSPSVTLPIFTGGANLANLEAAKVSQKQAVAAYEKSIQSAFREVNDAVSAEASVSRRLAAQDELVKATETAYKLAELRYKHGVDSYLAVLDAERAMVGAQQAQIGTRLERAVSFVTLYKVLGGGAIETVPETEKAGGTRTK